MITLTDWVAQLRAAHPSAAHRGRISSRNQILSRSRPQLLGRDSKCKAISKSRMWSGPRRVNRACERLCRWGGWVGVFEGERLVHSERPLNRETSITALSGGVTSNAEFYVRNHFKIPLLDPGTWRLTVEVAMSTQTGPTVTA